MQEYMENIIEVKNLKKIYKRRKRHDNFLKGMFERQYEEFKAVNDISFTIEKGEAVGYVGPNGSGKSTTIKMLSGILQPTSGAVYVNGIAPLEHRLENNKNIGVVFGNKSQLWWDVPVKDSFLMLKKLYNIPDVQFNNNLEEFVNVLNLKELLNVPERQLSLGQRVRSNITDAFLHDPSIVYLDEPTIGLDTESKDSIRAFIKRLNDIKKVTFVITSHDYQDIETLCKRIILINHGKIILDSPIENVREEFNRYKTISIKCEGNNEVNCAILEETNFKIVGVEADHIQIEYDTESYDPVELLWLLRKKLSIKDVVISDRSIEAIIKDIVHNQ